MQSVKFGNKKFHPTLQRHVITYKIKLLKRVQANGAVGHSEANYCCGHAEETMTTVVQNMGYHSRSWMMLLEMRSIKPYVFLLYSNIGSHPPITVFIHFNNYHSCIKYVWSLWINWLNFAPNGPINNIPALVHIMTWCRAGDKQLSEPITHAYMCHSASMRYGHFNTFSLTLTPQQLDLTSSEFHMP